MIPKRKLIKKRYTAPANSELTNDDIDIDNIPEQLQAADPKVKMDAIAALANLEQFDDDFLIPSVLIDIVKILYEANSSLVHSCLFAIANICQIQPVPTIKKLFEIGLDKALMQVNSSDANLVKPMIMLMTVLSTNIPSNFTYLITGIQNMIMTGGLPVNKQHQQQNVDLSNPFTNPEYSDLVLQFLMRTEYSFQNPQNPPNQLAIVNSLMGIAETHKSYRYRAMAARILISLTKANTPEHLQIFTSLSEQMLTDFDLQKEYDSNVCRNTGQEQRQIEQNIEEQVGMEDCNDEQEMEQENRKGQKGKKKKGHKVMHDEVAYKQWMDAVEGLQTALQLIKQVLENQNNFEDQEEQDNDEEEIEEEMGEEGEEEKNNGEWNHAIVDAVLLHVLNSCKSYEKLIGISYVEGQPIIELILSIVLSLPKSFFANNPMTIDYFVHLAETCLISLFQNQMKAPHKIPVEYLSLNTNLCLQVILKFKKIGQRNIYVELPTLSYQQQSEGSRILEVKSIWKESWQSLMEIYSMFFNPEKNPVAQEQNLVIGNVLKHLIINIPEMQLEEWRCQVIDTVFDVYSNESFDKVFMDLGFVFILSEVLKKAGPGKQKGKKKGEKKKNKFVADVLMDINRFLEYKKKMIGF